MITQPVPQPAIDCALCQQQYQQLVDLYRLWTAVPADPGARGLFEATQQDYESHHRQNHPGQAHQMAYEK